MIEKILQSTQKVEKGNIVDWFQHILNYLELVEDSSWVIDPDESLI